MDNSTYKLCGVALIAALAAFLLRNIKRELEVPLTVCGILLLTGAALLAVEPAIEYAAQLLGGSQIVTQSAETLIKMLGIVWVTGISADVCREMGAGSIASSLELAARIEIVILTLPLIGSVLATVGELMSEAGL